MGFGSTNNYINSVNRYQDDQNKPSDLNALKTIYDFGDTYGDVKFAGKQANYGKSIVDKYLGLQNAPSSGSVHGYPSSGVGEKAFERQDIELPEYFKDLGYENANDLQGFVDGQETEGLLGYLKNITNPTQTQMDYSAIGEGAQAYGTENVLADFGSSGGDMTAIEAGPGTDGAFGSGTAGLSLMALLLAGNQIGKKGSWANKNLKVR